MKPQLNLIYNKYSSGKGRIRKLHLQIGHVRSEENKAAGKVTGTGQDQEIWTEHISATSNPFGFHRGTMEGRV